MSTQRERMLRGEPYDTRDAELLALAHRARALIASFTAAPSTDLAARRSILAELLGSVGEEVWIEPPFFVDYGAHVHIGDRTFVNVNCVFLDSAEIRIGTDSARVGRRSGRSRSRSRSATECGWGQGPS